MESNYNFDVKVKISEIKKALGIPFVIKGKGKPKKNRKKK